jgi:acetyltransferase-like isoleucine patch superfamily enzyme
MKFTILAYLKKRLSIKQKKTLIESVFKGPILGEENIIENFGTVVNSRIDLNGDGNKIIISKGATFFNTSIFIRGNNHQIFIGEDYRIKGGSIWMEDNQCEIYISAKTSIGDAHIAATENGRKILLGEDCMLSKNIEIRTGDSHSIIDITSGSRINDAKDVLIGNHVWIGAHAKILKGVTIGENSIIGINSVVTKNVPSNVICAGIPARVVRKGITWDRKRI